MMGQLVAFSNYSPGCLVLHRMTAVSLAFGVAYLDKYTWLDLQKQIVKPL